MLSLIKIFSLLSFTFLSLNVYADTFHGFKVKDTEGKDYDFGQLKGKVVILTNIATKCGFTGQLDDLERVYQKYKNKNVVVVGVPSNNFLSQTPESNKEVGNFCRLKYGATFPILSKQEVIGSDKSPLLKWVHQQKGYEGPILWNFEKFIINRQGKIVDRFRSITKPTDESFIKSLEQVLN